MTPFDRFVIVDWSASATPSPAAPSADAIWIGVCGAGTSASTSYHRTRSAAMGWLRDALLDWRSTGERVMIGFDFPFGFPVGFAKAVAGADDPFAVWEMLADRIEDSSDNTNNRFEVARALNASLPGIGPFWGCPEKLADDTLPMRGRDRSGHGLAERREVERQLVAAHTLWKLYPTGSVGSQSLMGLPRLAAMRREWGDALSVWPFEHRDTPIVLAEVYPSLIAETIGEAGQQEQNPIKDALQVRHLAMAFAEAQRAGTLQAMFAAVPQGPASREEGWILGVGAERDLNSAARAAARPDLQPPRLSNDCFALPQGVKWTPVDVARDLLRARLHPVVGEERVATGAALGRFLACDHKAARSNPPGANSAVDGFGFAGAATGGGRQVLPLLEGRAAAGSPFSGRVPEGSAIRVLTGALIPEGVDTVVLQEDVRADASHIAFDGPIKRGANTRKAGEDVAAGEQVLAAGRQVTPADIGYLSATGVGEAAVYRRLRVGVLSTGDEIVATGADAPADKTYDANRPMLLAMAARWGHAPVDLGHVGDDRAALRKALDAASERSDVILTSGGASAGDEDHVSALLKAEGNLQSWRIAIKPGRPLALAMWKGVPVFGLPGNPVAAMVCTLVFGWPAFSLLAGGGWREPKGLMLPAAFSKRKKPGRREYLRARLGDTGAVEVFASEGSGRISGLSWAEGLCEIGDGARDIEPGDLVRYLPYGAFGL